MQLKNLKTHEPMNLRTYEPMNSVLQFFRSYVLLSFGLLVIVWLLFLGYCNFASAMTLNESVDYAVKNNPQMVSARKNLDAANARLFEAGSALVPHITLNGSTGKNYNQPMTVAIPSMGAFSIYPDEAANVSTYSFSLSQPIFTGGKLANAYYIADASYQIISADFSKNRNEVTFNAITAYFNVLKVQKSLIALEKRMDNTEKYLKQVQVFYEQGMATKADLLFVETALANARQGRIGLKNGLALAKIAYNIALGLPPSAEVVLNESEFIVEDMPLDVNVLLSKTYDNRPEWKSFLQAKRIVDTGVGLAWGGFSPNISLVGAYGRTNTNFAQAGRLYDLGSWNAMISGSWNIFDGFYNVSKVNEAQALADSIKAQEELVKSGIEADVSSAVLDLGAATEKIAATKVSADLSEKTLKYVQISYKAQIATNLAVLEAEQNLYNAEVNLWSAKYDYQVAKAKLNKVVGIPIFAL
ncbi:MAG: TolC family protein [Candidatus Saganbacteria bacterium]|nr:TolC family protein [Candidatus Saganbacteria bacterium]